nr:Hpt domain-containing protein [Rhabdochromatium marinum]
MGDDQDIAAVTIEQFLADVPLRLQGLRAAHQAQDVEALRFKAHSLKGLAGAVSALRLQHLAKCLEQEALHLAPASALVDQIEQEYVLLEPLLRAVLED